MIDPPTLRDSYEMSNRNRCSAHPGHVMVNQGRDEALAGDLYRCDCGESALGNTDEGRGRCLRDASQQAAHKQGGVS